VSHYTSDELLAYLAANDAIVDLEEIETHLKTCKGCRERLRLVEEDYLRISDPAVWSEALDGPPAERLAEYLAIHRRILDEDAAAEIIFATLVTLPQETWLEHLAAAPGARTAGMMRRLIAAARANEESEPRAALAILDIAEALSVFVEDHEARTNALLQLWRARAMALMIRGDFPAALSALDTAELSLAGAAADYDRAFVDWARASVHFEMGSYGLALGLVEQAIATFREFGDKPPQVQASILRGGILYEQGAIDEAELTFLSLVEPLGDFGDRLSLARVFANLACCRLQRCDFVGTETHGARALALYDEVRLESEKIRTRWAFALVYIRRGEIAEGIARLRAVAAEFRAHDMVVDAAEAELDIVAALIREGSHEEAAHIVRELVAVFVRAEARLDLVKALAYLRNATAAAWATPELVRSVKHVLTHPDQPFLSPDEA
jgi:tetratricopeptide (TPR) repeat protein